MKKTIKANVELKEIGIVLLLIIIFIGIYLVYLINFEKDTINENNNKLSSQILSIPSECEGVLGQQRDSCIAKYSQCATDNCFYDKARIETDSKGCMDIADEALRITCSAAVNYDMTVQGAVLNDNVLECDNLLDDSGRVACRDNYYYASAMNKQDKSYCEKITEDIIRNDCFN